MDHLGVRPLQQIRRKAFHLLVDVTAVQRDVDDPVRRYGRDPMRRQIRGGPHAGHSLGFPQKGATHV